MIKIEEYVLVIKNVLSKDFCNKIIKDSEAYFVPSVIMNGVVNKARTCVERPLPSKYSKEVYNGISKIIKTYNKKFSNFLSGVGDIEDTGYTHLLYKGKIRAEYTEHTDHFDLHPRVLSCSLLLNDNYEGGKFSFFQKELIIQGKQGDAIVFPSNFCFPHAVTPVTNGDRHAIVTWIL